MVQVGTEDHYPSPGYDLQRAARPGAQGYHLLSAYHRAQPSPPEPEARGWQAEVPVQATQRDSVPVPLPLLCVTPRDESLAAEELGSHSWSLLGLQGAWWRDLDTQ